MDPITQQLALASAGAGGAVPLYVDDVFSTYLYDGNNTTGRDIVNGIDLSGEGGLVWVKKRNTVENNVLIDTERGANNFLISDNTDDADTSGGPVTAFNSNGFEVDNNGYVNANSSEYASWTFRKAPGFFDVVTYTGNGTSQNISHNLGSVPGAIFIKCTTTTRDWVVYHRSTGATKHLKLNTTDGATTNQFYFDDTTPTASSFRVADAFDVNQSGQTFVAYLFAHDDQSFGTNSDEAIIKCGSYTGNSSTSNVVNVGFEPQWLLVKRSDDSGQDWHLFDVMRGMTGNKIARLYPNSPNDEAVASGYGVQPLANGFDITASGTDFNGNNYDYIYIAIRRPHKPPEAGTDVFAAQDGRSASDGSASQSTYTSGFPVDLIMRHTKSTDSARTVVFDRLRDENYLLTHSSVLEASGDFILFDDMDGVYRSSVSANTGLFAHMFKRAPGFFDMLAYDGTGSTLTLNHNLTVAPELAIYKLRSGSAQWFVDSVGQNKFGELTSNNYFSTGLIFNNGYTSSTISTTDTGTGVNASGSNYIAYLFASLSGISKVGTYSGTGSDGINVDCGFTAGARFVMIKRTDDTGDWFVWDSARGIVSGNDPYVRLNSTGGQTTDTDYIDPLNAGFTVNGSTFDQINASGGTYLFLAIA